MSEELTTAQVAESIQGFWPAAIILTGRRVGLYDLLNEGPKTTEETIQGLKTDPRATRILLDALTALGVLHKNGDRYRLAAGLADILVAGRPGSQAHRMDHLYYMWDAWGHLPEVLHTGRPWQPVEQPGSSDEKRVEAFIGAMFEVGQEPAAELVRRLDLSSIEQVLDIGGGPGTYCIALARAKATLRATILDRQVPLRVARRHIEAAGLADRITPRVGDALADDYGNGFDLALISQLFHAYGPEENRRIMKKAAGALRVGGLLVVNEFALDEDHVSPPNAAIFAVNMLANTADGRTYTVAEITGWMTEAGLGKIRTEELLGRSTLFYGRKP